MNMEEVRENPENMLSIMLIYESGGSAEQPKKIVLPSNEEFSKFVENVALLEEDPSKTYNFGDQLGRSISVPIMMTNKPPPVIHR